MILETMIILLRLRLLPTTIKIQHSNKNTTNDNNDDDDIMLDDAISFDDSTNDILHDHLVKYVPTNNNVTSSYAKRIMTAP